MKALTALALALALALAAPAVADTPEPSEIALRWASTVTPDTLNRYMVTDTDESGKVTFRLVEEALAEDGFPDEAVSYLRLLADGANAAGSEDVTTPAARRALRATCSNSDIDCLFKKLKQNFATIKAKVDWLLPPALRAALRDTRFLSYVGAFIAANRAYYINRASLLMIEALKYGARMCIGATALAALPYVVLYTAVTAIVQWIFVMPVY